MFIKFEGYVRRTRAYDTASMDLHQPEDWLIEVRNGVILPPPEANTGSKFTEYSPVRWVSGYPENGSWGEYLDYPERYSKDATDRVFGSAQV